MLAPVYRISEKYFDRLMDIWHSVAVHRWISRILALIFVISLFLGYAVERHWIEARGPLGFFKNPFVAIEVAFSLLLITEIFSLIFILPVSVARSVGKQFELLSLIFIRYAFKEFSHIHRLEWSEMKHIVLGMFIYAMGSVVIFALVGLLYKIQRRVRICESFVEDRYFKQFRKFVALLILFTFIIILFKDAWIFLTEHNYAPSYHDFYSILIFSDILILLVSIRYSLDYHSMYRYSGYILATIFIRIALTADPYANILIGVGAIVYLLLLTWTYNFFLKRQIRSYPVRMHYHSKQNVFKYERPNYETARNRKKNL